MVHFLENIHDDTIFMGMTDEIQPIFIPQCNSFPPNADSQARILILGSMPGCESLRAVQYYAHPRNAFWKIAGILFQFDSSLPYEERLRCLREAHVALWDTLQQCRRAGSLDTHIRAPRPNDIPGLLKKCPKICRICCNGQAAGQYLKKFFPEIGVEVRVLPSTSPAAAMFTFEQKLQIWRDALTLPCECE